MWVWSEGETEANVVLSVSFVLCRCCYCCDSNETICLKRGKVNLFRRVVKRTGGYDRAQFDSGDTISPLPIISIGAALIGSRHAVGGSSSRGDHKFRLHRLDRDMAGDLFGNGVKGLCLG